ncbi:hypothetical protein AYI74_02665 [Shewanella algae]|nr:hypothetical protein BS332_00675 [Shewanella algae]PBQ25517.1 hypothetical protein AYI97_19075 [Shewanella algae]PSS66225.1 hypothetical protein AYI85_18735 [Shewanella algae]PSS73013.1 hypothetical protein AYI88_10260 [Shewanella algae]PST67086.1 hypothetical protein AYI77_10050 [Shewanella algae]
MVSVRKTKQDVLNGCARTILDTLKDRARPDQGIIGTKGTGTQVQGLTRMVQGAQDARQTHGWCREAT